MLTTNKKKKRMKILMKKEKQSKRSVSKYREAYLLLSAVLRRQLI